VADPLDGVVRVELPLLVLVTRRTSIYLDSGTISVFSAGDVQAEVVVGLQSTARVYPVESCTVDITEVHLDGGVVRCAGSEEAELAGGAGLEEGIEADGIAIGRRGRGSVLVDPFLFRASGRAGSDFERSSARLACTSQINTSRRIGPFDSVNPRVTSRYTPHLVLVAGRTPVDLQLRPRRINTVGNIKTLVSEDLDAPQGACTFASGSAGAESPGLVGRSEGRALLKGYGRAVGVRSCGPAVTSSKVGTIVSVRVGVERLHVVRGTSNDSLAR